MTGEQSTAVLDETLVILRDAGLDDLVTKIDVSENEDGGLHFEVKHVGNDDDDAAITTAVEIALSNHGHTLR